MRSKRRNLITFHAPFHGSTRAHMQKHLLRVHLLGNIRFRFLLILSVIFCFRRDSAIFCFLPRQLCVIKKLTVETVCDLFPRLLCVIKKTFFRDCTRDFASCRDSWQEAESRRQFRQEANTLCSAEFMRYTV